MATTQQDRAPDFGRTAAGKPTAYPSAGRIIGPAWQSMWSALADGEWRDGAELAVTVGSRRGCSPKTARNLLAGAATAGLIEREERIGGEPQRWRTWYRRERVALGVAVVEESERIAQAIKVPYNSTAAIAIRRKAAAAARGES